MKDARWSSRAGLVGAKWEAIVFEYGVLGTVFIVFMAYCVKQL